MSKRHLEASIFGDPAHGRRHDATSGPHATAVASAPVATVGYPPYQTAEARVRHRRRRGGRRLVVLLLTLAVVAGAGYLAVSYLRSVLPGGESQDYPGPGAGSVTIVVKSGDTGRTIADTLVAADVVKTTRAFTDAAEANPDSASIRPGTYAMRLQMSGAGAVAHLLDPANRTVPRVTIREGLWASEVFAALSKATGTPVAEYQAAVKDPQSIGLPAVAKGNVEGYLFPASYELEPKSTAATQLRTLVGKTLDELDRLGVPPARYQRVLTVASIVESEVARAADRPKVARVIENRLAAGMMLQMDSTVHYAVRKRGTVTTTDSQRASASPYNTYRVTGLPPGPISNPGRSAMEAAVRPSPGAWIFFVTVDPVSGETRFNTTAAGHAADVRLFQAWCRAHPGKC